MIVFVLGNQLLCNGKLHPKPDLRRKLGETIKYIMLPLSRVALCRNFTLPWNDPQKGKFGPEVLLLDGNLSEKSLFYLLQTLQFLRFTFLFLETNPW